MNFNQHINLENEIGKSISQEQFDELMMNGMIYTSIREVGGKKLCGMIVASSVKEANEIANERGLNEIVDGILIRLQFKDGDKIITSKDPYKTYWYPPGFQFFGKNT